MRLKFEHIFNHWTLLTLNILIITVIQLNHMFFIQTGLIHLLAVIFVALGLARLWFHPQIHDQYIKPIIRQGIFALLILATAHIIEYASYRFGLPRQTIYANNINFYLTGLLLIILGGEAFLREYLKAFNPQRQRFSTLTILICKIGLVIFPLLILLYFISPTLVNLHPNNWHMYLYILAAVIVTVLGIVRLRSFKRHATFMVSFINYFTAAFIIVCLCALLSASEELLVGLKIPSIQIAMVNHFLFYGALSLMFLAYQRVLNVHDLEEEKKVESES